MLRVPERVYNRRLERMAYLIRAKAPRIIIYHEARLILKGWMPSRWDRFSNWLTGSRLGYTLYCLFDGEWWSWKLTGVSEVYDPRLDDEASLSRADLMEKDLEDPDFLLTLSPEKLQDFIQDIAKARGVSLDTETAEHGDELRIDTSDIPEVTNWDGAEVGKFYRPLPVNTTVTPHKYPDKL